MIEDFAIRDKIIKKRKMTFSSLKSSYMRSLLRRLIEGIHGFSYPSMVWRDKVQFSDLFNVT